MRKLYSFLIFIVPVLFFTSCQDRLSDSNNNENKNLVLDQIKKKTNEVLNKSNLSLQSYTKVGEIKSQSDIDELTSKLTDPSVVHIPLISHKDFSNIKISTIAELRSKKKSSLTKELFNREMVNYLQKKVKVGNEIYNLHYQIDDKKFDTYAVVNKDSLIYDEIISNAVDFSVEESEDIKVIQNNIKNRNFSNSTSSKQLQVSSSKTLRAEWIFIGYERGMAEGSVTIKYLQTCYGDEINRSSCQRTINGNIVSATCFMQVGTCGAKKRNLGYTDNHASGAYGIYIATPGVSATVRWEGSHFVVDANTTLGSIGKHTELFSRSATSLPLR